jgi:hypothetical protein
MINDSATQNLAGFTPAALSDFTRRCLLLFCQFSPSGRHGPPEKSAERPRLIFRFPDIYNKTQQNSRRVTGRADPERNRLCLDKGGRRGDRALYVVVQAVSCLSDARFPVMTENGKAQKETCYESALMK